MNSLLFLFSRENSRFAQETENELHLINADLRGTSKSQNLAVIQHQKSEKSRKANMGGRGLWPIFWKARAYKFLEFTIPPLIPNLSLQTEYQDRLIPSVNGMITEAIPLGCFMFKQCVQVSDNYCNISLLYGPRECLNI